MAHELETLYTPRTMLKALEQKPAPSSFLRDMFVTSTEEHDTDVIEIDIEKSGQTVAAYVARGGDANRVAMSGFTTNLHVIPYVNEEMRFTPKDLKVRLAGETAYSSGAKKRLNSKVGKGLSKLRDRFKNLEELQLSQSLQTGLAVISGKDVSYTVNFQMDPNHIMINTGDDLWDDTDSKKIEQLREMAALPVQAGAPAPTVVIMGVDAAAAFIDDDDVKEKVDLKNYNTGHIDFKQLNENKATYLGHINEIGLSVELYSYQATYTDDQGATQFFFDRTKIVMGSTTARVTAHYGMIENLNHGSHIGKEFPDFVVDPKGKYADLSLESGPLMAVHQPDAFVVRKVLA